MNLAQPQYETLKSALGYVPVPYVNAYQKTISEIIKTVASFPTLFHSPFLLPAPPPLFPLPAPLSSVRNVA